MCWLKAAECLYIWLFGPAAPESLYAFFIAVLTTSHGWTLIILGHSIGFAFAVAVLSISVVSFPLLLDRNVGVTVAVHTSLRAVLASPFTMGLWELLSPRLTPAQFAERAPPTPPATNSNKPTQPVESIAEECGFGNTERMRRTLTPFRSQSARLSGTISINPAHVTPATRRRPSFHCCGTQ